MSPLKVLRARDWATVAGVLLFAALVGIVGYLVVDGQQARSDAVTSLADSRDRATRRIDLLQQSIDNLQGQVQSQAIEVGEARQQIADLEAQVRQLGGKPITTHQE